MGTAESKVFGEGELAVGRVVRQEAFQGPRHLTVIYRLSQMPQIKDLLANADFSDSLAQARQSSSTET